MEPRTSVVARAAELMQDLVQLKQSWEENRFTASQSLEDVLSVAGRDYLGEVLGEGAGVGCGPFLGVGAVGCDEGDVFEVSLWSPSGRSEGIAVKANVAAIAGSSGWKPRECSWSPGSGVRSPGKLRNWSGEPLSHGEFRR